MCFYIYIYVFILCKIFVKSIIKWNEVVPQSSVQYLPACIPFVTCYNFSLCTAGCRLLRDINPNNVSPLWTGLSRVSLYNVSPVRSPLRHTFCHLQVNISPRGGAAPAHSLQRCLSISFYTPAPNQTHFCNRCPLRRWLEKKGHLLSGWTTAGSETESHPECQTQTGPARAFTGAVEKNLLKILLQNFQTFCFWNTTVSNMAALC